MKKDYLRGRALVELSIDQLPAFIQKWGIQRQYIARNSAFTFDMLSDEWQLETKEFVRLDFMRTLDLPAHIYLALRTALAFEAELNAANTVKNLTKSIKKIDVGWQSYAKFQQKYHVLTDANKAKIKSFFTKLSNDQTTDTIALKKHFKPVIEFLENQEYPRFKALKGIFDPKKGIYTDEEESEIYEKLRIKTSEMLQSFDIVKTPFPKQVLDLGILISLILLKTIYRRTVQLCMLKWSDVLPIGISFVDHRYAKLSPHPKLEFNFADVDQIHIRTFKAKNGYIFRAYAEHKSHRLEPEQSKLVAIYRLYYRKCFLSQLSQQGITLNQNEAEDLLSRCPLFPEIGLFKMNFPSKQALFETLGHQSDVMHKNSKHLFFSMRQLSEELQLTSTRIQKFHISNNRSRHTVITRAIEHGYSLEQSAAITGVTTDAVRNYTHLDMKGRVQIDEVVAKNKIFSQFAKLGIEELKGFERFTIKNEFNEEQGTILKQSHCETCQSKLCKPLGCYGCDNFRPFLDVDHQVNLEKIEQKIKFNEGAEPQTLKNLYKIRAFIRAVIILIHEKKISGRGVTLAD